MADHIPATAQEIGAIRAAHFEEDGDCATCLSGFFDQVDGWCVSRESWPCQFIRVVWAWDALRALLKEHEWCGYSYDMNYAPCAHCEASLHGDPHEPNCRWLQAVGEQADAR